MTAWKVSKPIYYAQNGYPIDTLPQQRLAKDYGQHVAAPNSPSQRIGEFVYNTSVEMEKFRILTTIHIFHRGYSLRW